ncbi:MAG TPA: hypothetical protein VF676_03365 [Flavobacterium sp.]|jgi:hypothetical protein
MKKISLQIALVVLMLTSFTSCDIVGDILEAGIWIGIIIVVLIVALIFWIIRKIKR